MNKRTQIFLIFLLGVLYGGIQWILFFQPFLAPHAFDGLEISEQRRALTKMVQYMKFSDVLKTFWRIYPEQEPYTHGLGHLLGEVAYKKYKESAFVFCDTIFNYGCYHGVVDMAIKTHGPKRDLARNIWETCEKEMPDPSPCIHPIGHITTITTQYDALEAFKMCDQIYPESKVAESCWQGAMMEYITRSSPGAPQQSYGNPKDPYYPCNTFPQKYEASCVRMHVNYLEGGFHYSYGSLVAYCLSFVDTDTIDACINEVGDMAGQAYFFDPEKAIAVCRPAGTYEFSCVMGVLSPFVRGGQRVQAESACLSLDGSEQRTCYDKIEDILDSL